MRSIIANSSWLSTCFTKNNKILECWLYVDGELLASLRVNRCFCYHQGMGFNLHHPNDSGCVMSRDQATVHNKLFPEIIGRSPELCSVLELVAKIAPSDSNILIQGESGTGKELIASAIHRISSRSNKRLFAINCGAIPENLLESELFGHERGAFTGADRKRQGYFELARGGTVFLDEIGDMPLALQAKLLRVLQEKKYLPLGGTETKTADVRIIAATNSDLAKEIASGGRFRLDLYYRLNVLPIHIPALRERPADLNELVQHFLKIYNNTYKIASPCYFNQQTIDILLSYRWPGNVRQLQNLVERLILTNGGGELYPHHLPAEFHDPVDPVVHPTPTNRVGAYAFKPGFKLNDHVRQIENDLISEALRTTGNNRNRAAKILGINRTTLVERIKKRQLG